MTEAKDQGRLTGEFTPDPSRPKKSWTAPRIVQQDVLETIASVCTAGTPGAKTAAMVCINTTS